MHVKRTAFLILLAVLAGLSLSAEKTSAAPVSANWNWKANNDLEGWQLQHGFDSHIVANGMLVGHASGTSDPILLSPEVAIDTSKDGLLEIMYINGTGNTSAQLYWDKGDGFSETNSQTFSTMADNQFHKVTINLRNNPNWSGTVTRLRFDPASGGAGDFGIDYLRIINDADRYSTSNGYFKLSGAFGFIDTLQFDPTGSGNYSEDLIANNFFLALSSGTDKFAASATDANWTINGSTLEIQGLKFGSLQAQGTWKITLDGNRLRNTFTITSAQNGLKVHSIGYNMQNNWRNDGFNVTDLHRIPFSYMYSSNGDYKSSYMYKRLPGADPGALFLAGDYIYWSGANGYNFDLVMKPDTRYLNPGSQIDVMDYQFYREYNSAGGDFVPETLNNGQSLTKEMEFILLPAQQSLPDYFPAFTGPDTNVNKVLNAMNYEKSFGWQKGATLAEWADWQMMQRSWLSRDYTDRNLEDISRYAQDTDGYILPWPQSRNWGFCGTQDCQHILTSSSSYILGAYRHIMNSGDLNFVKLQMPRMRDAMNFLLSYYDETEHLFINTHPDHDGTPNSSGSDYWDIQPHGYKDAYGNIYAYAALNAMSEIERMVGNTTRSTELTSYASDLKTAYNTTFWRTNHFISTIDVNGVERDYGPVFLNLEAFFYGLGDATKANTFFNWASTVVTSSGSADVFSKWIFGPRSTVYNNPKKADGGWWIDVYDSNGVFGDQIQNGGSALQSAFFEIVNRVRYKGATDAYERYEEMMDRYKLDHLSGGDPLYRGEFNQHLTGDKSVGVWGEFPEGGLVSNVMLYGFMGATMDLNGLHFSPQFPATGTTSMTLEPFHYWGMKLKITASNTSVRIQALENNSQYTDWSINETPVSGLFDETITLAPGGTVTLSRATQTYDLNQVPLDIFQSVFAVDDSYDFFINGRPISDSKGATARHAESYLRDGLNEIKVSANNLSGPAGVIGELTLPNGQKIVTDTTWKVQVDGVNPRTWSNATDYGAYGASPWGVIDNFPSGSAAHWIWSGSSSDKRITLIKTFWYNKPVVTASSSVEDADYGKEKLLDGIRTPASGAKGWSSSTAYNDPNHVESITFDLNSAKRLSMLKLYPMMANGRYAGGFPEDFSIQVSADGASWTTIRSVSGATVNDTLSTLKTYRFKPQDIRYLRVEATKLGIVHGEGKYRFQLAEMEVYNE